MADWTKFLFCIFVIHTSTVGSKSVKQTECEYDGQYYNASSTFHLYNCTYGYCNEYGYVEYRELNSSDCPSALCNNAVTDGCCPTCPKGPGCEYNGTFYELNSFFQVDHCKYGVCDASGTWNFAMALCAYPYCENPKPVPGQCCPVCPDEPIPTETLQYSSLPDAPSSPETTQPPRSTEAQISSENIQPPSSSEVQISSETTPRSSTETISSARKKRKATGSCMYEGRKYKVDDIFRPSPCEICICNEYNTVICYGKSCPPKFKCTNKYESYPDSCCPVCEDEEEASLETSGPNTSHVKKNKKVIVASPKI